MCTVLFFFLSMNEPDNQMPTLQYAQQLLSSFHNIIIKYVKKKEWERLLGHSVEIRASFVRTDRDSEQLITVCLSSDLRKAFDKTISTEDCIKKSRKFL